MKFTILIPCYNEEKTIKRKIENCLALNQDLLREIIIIDDNSTDSTRSILESIKNKRIKFCLNKYRKGKNGATKTGLELVKTDLVVITDSDVVFGKDSLEKALVYFKDPKVGGICFSTCLNGNKRLMGKYAGLYEKVNRGIKILQSRIDSIPTMHGQAMVFRKELRLAPRFQADDIDLANQIRKQGYKIKYAHNIPFNEKLIDNEKMLQQQKYRRCRNVMTVLSAHSDVLFNPKYGKYGFFCFPIDFFLYFIQPLVILTLMISGILLLYFAKGFIITGVAILLFIISSLILAPLKNYLIINFIAFKSLFSREEQARWLTENK